VISSVPVPDIAAYHDAAYIGPNLVIAAAGALEHERLVELVDAAVRPAAGERRATDPLADWKPRVCFHTKQTEQYHLCLGAPGLARNDERRYVLRVLDTILGGSSSSRLFQEVREKRGLAYSVYSYSSQYLDAGQVAVYVGTRPDRVREAMQVIGDELRKLQDSSITAEELERAKENVKGRTVLSMESTLTRMNRLGASVLMDIPLLSLDEIVATIDAITLDDVQALARELWAPERMSAAGVGGDEQTFLGALDAVNPELAAAA
jgi:predicted Zn-dependent peptidase